MLSHHQYESLLLLPNGVIFPEQFIPSSFPHTPSEQMASVLMPVPLLYRLGGRSNMTGGQFAWALFSLLWNCYKRNGEYRLYNICGNILAIWVGTESFLESNQHWKQRKLRILQPLCSPLPLVHPVRTGASTATAIHCHFRVNLTTAASWLYVVLISIF